MQHTCTDLPPMGEYVDLNGLLPQVEKHFPTLDSIRWFYRNNREQLGRAGAVIAIAGRLHFHPQRFQQVAVEIGRQAVER